jgi:hypothetical protein
MNFDSLFIEGDDAKFIGNVTTHLKEGAPALHQLSPEEYVTKCREMWTECELDEVFNFKIIVDNLALRQNGPKGLPWEGMEEVPSADAIEEDLYCISCGLMTPDGQLIGAPEGYDSRPKNPRTKRTIAVAMPAQVPAEETDDAKPEPYLLALLDFLGFEHRLATSGLERMRELYDKLIQTALKPSAEERLWSPMLAPVGPGRYSPGLFWLPMRYAYFSDSLLLWVPYRPEFVAPFLSRCSDVVCEALYIGVPLRGAISAGHLILHKKTNTFLGAELVEAARLEKAQDWLGVSLGVSVRSEQLRIPFDPRFIRLYQPPLKPSTDVLFSGLVLDWPQRWKHPQGKSAVETVDALRTPDSRSTMTMPNSLSSNQKPTRSGS